MEPLVGKHWNAVLPSLHFGGAIFLEPVAALADVCQMNHWYDGIWAVLLIGLLVAAIFHAPITATWKRWRKRKDNGMFRPEDLERYRKRHDEEGGE